MTSMWCFYIIFGVHSTIAQMGYTRDNPFNQLAINPHGRPMGEADLSSEREIPGEAGQDYPIYAAPPDTGFNCRTQAYLGYYADPEARCQVFYICQKGGHSDAFLCPNGTIFNQEYLVCDWWYNFDCNRAEQLYVVNEMVVKAMEAVDAKFRQNIGGNNNVPISTVERIVNNGGIQYSPNIVDNLKVSQNQYNMPNQAGVRPPINNVYDRQQNNRIQPQYNQNRQFSNAQRRNDGHSDSKNSFAISASTYRPTNSRSGLLARNGPTISDNNRNNVETTNTVYNRLYHRKNNNVNYSNRSGPHKTVKNTLVRILNNFGSPSTEPIENGLSENGFNMNRFQTNNDDNRFPNRSYLPPSYNQRRQGSFEHQGANRMYLPPTQNSPPYGRGDRSFVTPLTSNHELGYYQSDSQPPLNSNGLRNLFSGQDRSNSGYNSYDEDPLSKSYLPPIP